MNFFRKSIIRKLMLLFFIVGIISLSLIGIYSYYKAKQAILQRTLDQLTSIRVMKKSQVGVFFRERMTSLDLLSRSVAVGKAFEQIPRLTGPPWPEAFPLIPDAGLPDSLTFEYGALYTILHPEAAQPGCYKLTDSCWLLSEYRAVNEHLVTLSGLLQTQPDGLTDLFRRFDNDTLPVCLIGTTIARPGRETTGLLALEISIRDIDNIMLEKSRENGLGQSGEAYLVGEDSLMRSNSRFIAHSVLQIPVHTTSVRKAFSNQTGSAIIDDYRDIPCLSSFSTVGIPGLNWVILAEIDYREAMVPIISIRNDLLLIALIVSVFIFSVAQIISRTITQPIIRLKNAALQIGQGKFDVAVETRGDDEISLLTRTFNDMAGRLERERTSRMSALYDGQELERQRISRELHDGIGQLLVALKIRFENHLSQCRESDIETITELRNEFTRTIEEVRRVSYNLAPGGIREFGLDGSLALFCKEISKVAGIEVDFASFGTFDAMPMKARNYLFRITQEGVSNAIRHGKAGKIEINLNEGTEAYILMIGDTGTGFQPETLKPGSGNGLYNIRERVRLLGGTFTIESHPGSGTTLRIKIPINTEKETAV